MDTQVQPISSLTPEQIEARRGRLGGSDAAAAAGVSPWKTPVQLWQEKCGLVPEPDLSGREFVTWGILLEDVVAEEAARRLGVKAHRVNETKVDKEHDFMCANIDRRIVGAREGLAIKTTNAWMQQEWGESGTDEVPTMYLIEGVHGMRVMNYNAWNYAVLIGGNELRTFRIERREESERVLIELEERFMEHVRTGTPPPPVNVDDVVRIHPKATGAVRATDEIMQRVVDYQNASAAEKAAKTEKEAAKFDVVAFMDDKSELLDVGDPTITIATFREFERKGYEVKPTSGRTFRVK